MQYYLGMRGYYVAISLALWLMGTLWLLGGTLVLLALMRHMDRTP